ncbi:MAG TPA: type II secretion system protein [Thermodesulfobacteriota bacterium]|nr:type II secretion system protein [Thermodesulfobacteriota bacterium]
MKIPKRDTRGFTLIEVVVAISILGLGLVVIMELFAGGLRSGRASQEHTKAAGYARLKIEEVSLARTLQEGVETGEFDREYRWSVDVRKVDLVPAGREVNYSPAVDLYRVRVEVI